MNNYIGLQSEYQQQFIGDKDGTVRENYRTMLRERSRRISIERSHTPFTWMDMNQNSKEDKRTTSILLDDSIIARSQSAVPDVGKYKSQSTSPMSTSSQSSSDEESYKENMFQRSQSVQTNFDTEKRDIEVQTPGRDRPWLKPKFTGRKKSATKRPIDKKSGFVHERPLIAYGRGDKSSLVNKKTYNVKAPLTSVKPSAFLAAKRREEQLRKTTTKKERVSQEKLKTQSLIESLTGFEHWQTVYQKEFCRK